jgi:hypothetical protein
LTTIRAVLGNLAALIRAYPVRAQAIIVAGLAVGTAFGLSWNGVQVGSVVALTAAVLGFLTEKAVTPNPVAE